MTTRIKRKMDLEEVLQHFEKLSDEDKAVFFQSPTVKSVSTKLRYEEIITRHEQREAALVVLNGPSKTDWCENISISDLRYGTSSLELAQAWASKDFPAGRMTVHHDAVTSAFPKASTNTSRMPGFPTFGELQKIMCNLKSCEDGSFEQAVVALHNWGAQQDPARDIRVGYFARDSLICMPKLIAGQYYDYEIQPPSSERPTKKPRRGKEQRL